MADSTLPVASKPQDPVNCGAGIELTVSNFSLSVIHPPSWVTLIARKLRLISNVYGPTDISNNTNFDNGDGAVSHNPTVDEERRDRDLRNVGINIFRNVDMSVKPGQGRVHIPSWT